MPRKTLKQLAAEQRPHVIETLQLYGDMPSITKKNACDQDWMHVLMAQMTDLMEACRVEGGDGTDYSPHKKAHKLGLIVATCEDWYQQIRRES